MAGRPATLFLFLQAVTLIALYCTQQIGIYYFELSPNNSFFAMSHVLGGMWVAFAVAWSLTTNGRRPSILACALTAFLVGILWEFFEVKAALTFFDSPTYPSDTMSDLVMDTLGGLLGAIAASRAARGYWQ